MKTSTISLRVVDFLKENPPFNFMDDEDLLELANQGRVKFHETDELIFEEGEERGRWMFVIQQGTVQIVRKTINGREHLEDIRVEGDLLGIFGIAGADCYIQTARTKSDTILYALDWQEFLERAKKYAKARRYLAAIFSLHSRNAVAALGMDGGSGETTSNIDAWLHFGSPISGEVFSNLLTCRKNNTIREVAKLICPGHQQAVVVTDEQNCPIGIITESDMVAKVATGDIPVDALAGKLMATPVYTVPANQSVGSLSLRMLHLGLRHLVVTEDGTVNSCAIGLVSDRDLAIYHGRLPTFLRKEFRAAGDARRLSRLRKRADELLYHYLDSGVSMNWLTDFVSEVDDAMLQRAVELARREMEFDERPLPNVSWAWIAFHTEGRKERFLRRPQRTGIIFSEVPEAELESVRSWFLTFADRVSQILQSCGFYYDSQRRMASNPAWCRTTTEWAELYSGWIQKPSEHRILNLTPFFDMRTLDGDASLVEDLCEHIHREIEHNPDFIPLLASDAIANLPPVTIFRDSVMDQEGTLWTCVDLQSHALVPLADLARVLSIRYGFLSTSSTVERFSLVAEVLPELKDLFDEAREAMRFVLGLWAFVGLQRGDDGQFVRPSEVSRLEQERLKNVFRTVARLMEFSQRHFELVSIED